MNVFFIWSIWCFSRNEKLQYSTIHANDTADDEVGVVQVAPQGVSFRKSTTSSIIDESAKVNELEQELANLRGNVYSGINNTIGTHIFGT